jgi:hypothetical protein
MQRVSPVAALRERRAGLGAGGHEGGEDVVRVAVEVVAGSVVAHGGARVGVAGGDLDGAQVDACVGHGGDEGVAEHVQVCPGEVDAGGFGEPAQAAGGGVPVWAPRLLSRTGPCVRSPTVRSIARPTAGDSGTRTILVPLPQTRSTRWPCSSPRSVMSVLVGSAVRRTCSAGECSSTPSMAQVR